MQLDVAAAAVAVVQMVDAFDLSAVDHAAVLRQANVELVFAAGLVILSSVSAMVLARYREFGMLKAVGFTPHAITTLVLAENLVVLVAVIVIAQKAGVF